jgi:transketolase
VVLIATGSEVATALDAAEVLEKRGIATQVVSMPCRELFSEQDVSYRNAVLPPSLPRVSIEAAVTLGWERWIGDTGLAIGIDRFGASAPDKVLAEKFGFTASAIADRVERWLPTGRPVKRAQPSAESTG